jgi:hypothetical protein
MVAGKGRRIGAAVLVALLTVLVYLPVLGNGFVNWDDPAHPHPWEGVIVVDADGLSCVELASSDVAVACC